MSHKPKHIIVVDGNNAAYRAYYKHSALKSINGTPTGIIYGFTHIIKGLLTQFKPDDIYVVFDGGRSKERMKILPNYKNRDKTKAGKRDFDKDDFYRQMQISGQILKCLGIKVIQRPKTEADDIIWLLIRKLKRKNKITLVSSDKDFNQCLSDNVEIWNPGRKLIVTTKNIKNQFGYEAKDCVDYLVLDGDASDKIPGMPGVGPKTAIKFLDEWGSIENYLSDPKSQFKKWDRDKLKNVYKINKPLIDLRIFARKYLTSKDLVIFNKGIKKIDKKELAFICADNSIRTFIKPPFIKAFQNLL